MPSWKQFNDISLEDIPEKYRKMIEEGLNRTDTEKEDLEEFVPGKRGRVITGENEIRKYFKGSKEYYFGHGTPEGDEIVSSIFQEGLRVNTVGRKVKNMDGLNSLRGLESTTITIGEGSDTLFHEYKEKLDNWPHNESDNIIIISLPGEYFLPQKQNNDRYESFYIHSPNDEFYFLRPEFIKGVYNANTQSFTLNENYYQLLSKEQTAKLFKDVKLHFIKSYADMGEVSPEEISDRLPLDEKEIEQATYQWYKRKLEESNERAGQQVEIDEVDEWLMDSDYVKTATNERNNMRHSEIQKKDENGNRMLHEYINPELLKRKVKLQNGNEIPARQFILENLFDYIPESGTFTLKSNGETISAKQYIEEYIMFELGNEKYNGDLEALLRDTVLLDEEKDEGDNKTSRKQKKPIYGTTIAQDREKKETEQRKNLEVEKNDEIKREGNNPEACKNFRQLLDRGNLRSDIKKANIRTNEITETQNSMAQDRKRKQSRGISR